MVVPTTKFKDAIQIDAEYAPNRRVITNRAGNNVIINAPYGEANSKTRIATEYDKKTGEAIRQTQFDNARKEIFTSIYSGPDAGNKYYYEKTTGISIIEDAKNKTSKTYDHGRLTSTDKIN